MSADWIVGKRRILVIAGTDVHPFARLCEWADVWADTHPHDDVLVQHGYTPAPLGARGVEMFTPADLAEALDGTDIAVCHGGPGTISTVRAAGLQPIVLPRDPARGEHVDGHQLRFAAWAGERGLAVICDRVDSLSVAVEAAVSRERAEAGPAEQIDATVRAIRAEITALLSGGPRRRRFPMLRRRTSG